METDSKDERMEWRGSKINVGFLYEHEQDDEWAEFLIDNYEEVVESFEDEEKPEACKILSSTVGGYGFKLPPGKLLDKCNLIALRVSRAGLNTLQTTKVNGKLMKDQLEYLEPFSDLRMSHGISLINLDRPIRALEYLDQSEKGYEIMAEQLGWVPVAGLKVKERCQSLYEYCRAKEAETWLRMLDGVPKASWKYWINCIQSYLAYSLEYFENIGKEEYFNYFFDVMGQAFGVQADYMDIEPDFIDKTDPDKEVEGYEGWCFYSVLYLNLFNEIPNPNRDWMNDDLDLKLDERHSIILEDVVRTFDHCRKILYEFTKVPIEERFSKVRDDSVESLIDCYVRLYSVLDKVAKIIDYFFSLDLSGKTASFWNVSEALAVSSNKYLRSIAMIKDDLFPKHVERINSVDPHFTFAMACYRSSFIRNSIIHDTFRIVGPDEKDYIQWNVAAITVQDLEYQTWSLMYTVREVILLTKMSVELERNKRGKFLSGRSLVRLKRMARRPGNGFLGQGTDVGTACIF